MAEIIEMPKLSDTMTVGTVVKWLKNEGDKIEMGDKLCEVETDKATMEVECFDEGTLLKRYVEEGDELPIGKPLAAIGEEGEEAPEAEVPSREEVAEAKESGEASEDGEDEPDTGEEKAKAPEEKEGDKEEPAAPAQAGQGEQAREEDEREQAKTGRPEALQDGEPATPPPAPPEKEGRRVKSSPLARKLAEQHGVDITRLKGSGPSGRIVKADVLEAAEKGTAPKGAPAPAAAEAPTAAEAPKAPPAAPIPAAPFGEEKDIKVSNMRGAIARRLVESKTSIPHFYLEIEVDAAALAETRKRVNASLANLTPEQGGAKLTVNDYILKATVEALRRVPGVNSSWQEKTIKQHGSVHLAFGVAIEDGLVTPVIRDAQAKTLRQIGAEAKELISRARERKLKPDEMSGSTFTVTNLGMFGISNFYGIINPPNAGILSVGATVTKPVVDGDGNLTVGQRMNVGFSGDHRVVDGATGALFLQALKEILETPALMMV